MTDKGMLERVAVRRAELDLAEEELMKQLAECGPRVTSWWWLSG